MKILEPKTANEALGNMAEPSSQEIYDAARLVLWLVIEKGKSLKPTVKMAANKYGVKMAPLERLVRTAFDDNYFKRKVSERAKSYYREGGAASPALERSRAIAESQARAKM